MNSLRPVLRSRLFAALTSRRFATAQAGAKAKAKAEKPPREEKAEKKEEDDQDEFEDENYETYNKTSKLRKLLRAVTFTGLGLFALHAYYGYKDDYLTDISQSRPLYVPFMYNAVLTVRGWGHDLYDLIVSPPVKKFLPDYPPLHPTLIPKTLVLNFEGTLVSKDFEAGSGVMLHLRPDLMNFLNEMAKFYEIVIYTNEDSQFLQDAVMTIDPMMRIFRWNFGRDYFALSGTKYVKDLRSLNRDLRKVVVVDVNEEFYGPEIPENVIFVKKYSGEVEDDNLLTLRMFLMHLARPEIKDVRQEIKKFGGIAAADNYKAEIVQKLQRMNRGKGLLGRGRPVAQGRKDAK